MPTDNEPTTPDADADVTAPTLGRDAGRGGARGRRATEVDMGRLVWTALLMAVGLMLQVLAEPEVDGVDWYSAGLAIAAIGFVQLLVTAIRGGRGR